MSADAVASAEDAFAVALRVLRASAEYPADERGGFGMAHVAVERLLAGLEQRELLDVAVALALLPRVARARLDEPAELDRWAATFAWAYSP